MASGGCILTWCCTLSLKRNAPWIHWLTLWPRVKVKWPQWGHIWSCLNVQPTTSPLCCIYCFSKTPNALGHSALRHLLTSDAGGPESTQPSRLCLVPKTNCNGVSNIMIGVLLTPHVYQCTNPLIIMRLHYTRKSKMAYLCKAFMSKWSLWWRFA